MIRWSLNDVLLNKTVTLFRVRRTASAIFELTFSNFCCYGDAITYFIRWNFNQSVCDFHARIGTLYSPVTVSTFLDSHCSIAFQRNLNLISSVVCGWSHFQVTVLPLTYCWGAWSCFFNSYIYFNLTSFFTLTIYCR